MKRVAVLLDRGLVLIERIVVVAAFVLLLVLAVYQVVVRNLDQAVPAWINPVLHQLVLWAGFVGGALATRAGSHIRFDVVHTQFSGSTLVWIERVVSWGSAIVCLLLARASLSFVQMEQETVSKIAGVPGWVFPVIIPVTFGVMALHFFLAPWLKLESGPSIGGSATSIGVSDQIEETGERR